MQALGLTDSLRLHFFKTLLQMTPAANMCPLHLLFRGRQLLHCSASDNSAATSPEETDDESTVMAMLKVREVSPLLLLVLLFPAI